MLSMNRIDATTANSQIVLQTCFKLYSKNILERHI